MLIGTTGKMFKILQILKQKALKQKSAEVTEKNTKNLQISKQINPNNSKHQ
jgi:hypothetical protein